jgi:uroporphyrinogen III methyltransferase/synthase
MVYMDSEQTKTTGLAVLVGAGPGADGLLTVEGKKWLTRADVVIYDRLASSSMLNLCRAEAEKIFVGKAPLSPRSAQDKINKLLVAKTQAGGVVVRLKGGDPLIFARGGEELDALAEAGCDFRVVPGISAGVAVGAFAGMALTDRRFSGTVAFVTAREDPARAESAIDFSALAKIGTVVFYMGVACAGELASRLIAAGRSGETPVAVVQNVSLASQRTLLATLNTLAKRMAQADVRPPAVIVVGDTAEMTGQLGWFEKLPMFNQRVIVTRSRSQVSRLTEALEELGAEVIEAPAIVISPLGDDRAFIEVMDSLAEETFDWIAFTSPNGVEEFARQCRRHGLDARALGRSKLAAVGPATAQALGRVFLQPDLVPDEFTTEAMGKALARFDNLSGKSILLIRSDIAPRGLGDILRQAGARVKDLSIYQTCKPASLPAEANQALLDGKVDWITFTSSSTVENFLALAGQSLLNGPKLAAIGPVTAEALKRHDLTPAVIAQPYTIDALLEAMQTYQP